jgi:1-acyl-sn-glycerol-3-phosphate acyltransferase
MTTGELRIPEGHERGEEMTAAQRGFYGAVRVALATVGRAYFRLEIHGRENIPRTGPFIIAPVHRSNLDTPMLGVVTRRRMRYMGKESLWRSAAGGWLLTALGGFPVERGTADRAALRAATAVIDRGEPLVMFPEGTRQEGPDVVEMFDGPAFVACRTGAPIVPVGIGGSDTAMPVGAKWVKPAKMAIVIGPALYPPPLKESGRVSRKAVRQMTTDLGAAIQVLYDEAQALVGSPNPRG